MYEKLIKRLRNAHGGPDGVTMCQEAADALENQQREIEGLKKIIEKQSGLNQKLADMALELDTVKAERDAAVAKLLYLCAHPTFGLSLDLSEKWRGPQKEE